MTFHSGIKLLYPLIVLSLALVDCPPECWAQSQPSGLYSTEPQGHIDTGNVDVATQYIEANGLPNFAKVSQGIYRSGQPTDAGFAQLEARGFKTVISLRVGPDDPALLSLHKLRGIHIAMPFTSPPTPEAEHDLLNVLSDSSYFPILIHCRRGIDRTGTIVALYRLKIERRSLREAFREMQSYGHSRQQFPRLYNYLVKLTGDSTGVLIPPRNWTAY